jgi:hypothetical protein
VPALLRGFGRGFFLRNRHFWSPLPRDDISLALIPGAAKLDAIGGIVNMFQSYPALRLVPLQLGYDDVR